MTLLESRFIEIIQGHGWAVTKEYSTTNPEESWWKAQLDENTKISHFTITGLFEAWLEHPKNLEEMFHVKLINPAKPKEKSLLRKVIEGI